MILVIPNPEGFLAYIASLSRHARKDWAYVKKHNEDLQYVPLAFDRELVDRFMQLWERQLVRGKSIQWAYPIGQVEYWAAHRRLRLFGAYRGQEPIAMHFIVRHDGFWQAEPPMYSKKDDNVRQIAKYMWFNLIRVMHYEHWRDPLNLGGGVDDWPEMIRRREEFPNPKYKWRYIPVRTQEHPEEQPHYVLNDNGETKCLTLSKN